MQQALHIFRKDVLRLWPQLALALAMALAFALVFSGHVDPNRDFEVFLLIVSVPAAFVWLIVSLVHQEPLPGERQFWVTRPYSIASLFLAKALFILFFVSGSLLLKDCIIVAAHGFAVAPLFAGILLRTFVWTIWIGIAAFAASAITKNIQQFAILVSLVGILTMCARMLFQGRFDPALDWVGSTSATVLIAIFGSLILVWQYRRRTVAARILAASCVVLLLYGVPVFSRDAAIPLQESLSKLDTSMVAVRAAPASLPSVSQAGSNYAVLLLPITVGQIDSASLLALDGLSASVSANGPEIPLSGWQNDDLINTTAPQFVRLLVDMNTLRAIKNQPTSIRLSLALTLLRKGTPLHVQPDQKRFQLEGMRCERVAAPANFSCAAAVRSAPRYLALYKTPEGQQWQTEIGAPSYGPFPLISDLMPVDIHPFLSPAVGSAAFTESPIAWAQRYGEYILTPLAPVAHFRRVVTFAPVRLADQVTPVRTHHP